MITMSTLGTNGRLGNQIMQYMAMIGLSKKTGQILQMPEWRYAPYFSLSTNLPMHKPQYINVHEHQFHYDKNFHTHLTDMGHYDVKGYFQTKKYWEHSEEEIKEQFEWDFGFKEPLRNRYHYLFQKETIAIHIRRGDYVNHKSYHNLHINYYITALDKITDWREKNILIFSDDPEYCKIHFGCLKNALVIEGNSDIEDMCLMSMFDYFILSNSSFAWCAAYLSNKPGSNIIHPAYHFKGAYASNHDTKDFWPSEWSCYDHITDYVKKIDLKDCTFMIPFYNDHQDRVKNLNLNLHMLFQHFDTNIIIGEQGNSLTIEGENIKTIYFPNEGLFHRTKILNNIAKQTTTKYIINWDTDVILAPMQMLEAVEKLRQGYEIVYPYDGTFNRIQRNPWFDMLLNSMDIGIATTKFESLQSWGGAVMYNKESFIRAGMENENFISFGPEDAERRERFFNLELKIERQKGPLYHIEHYRGINSGKTHSNIEINRAERNKVKAMNKEQLMDYINTWSWLQ